MSDAGSTLRRVIEALDASGATHMIVGSFASTFHGEPRTTRDIDIVVQADSQTITRFVESLPESEWYADADAAKEAHAHESMFNVIDIQSGWKVDVICLRAGAFAKSEFSRRLPVDILGARVFIASAEDTILAKLSWCRDSGSERQLRDVAGIVSSIREELDREYLNHWIDELGLAALWLQISSESE